MEENLTSDAGLPVNFISLLIYKDSLYQKFLVLTELSWAKFNTLL